MLERSPYRTARRARQAIAALTPVHEAAAWRTTAALPDFRPDGDLELLPPAGVVNGTSRDVRYPWDDDPEPA